LNTLTSVLAPRLFELGRFLPAWGAPTGEKVDDNDLSFLGAQVHRTTVEGCQLEFRHWTAQLRRFCRLVDQGIT
jgi:hypothetical protein